jgi:hypothetical protein
MCLHLCVSYTCDLGLLPPAVCCHHRMLSRSWLLPVVLASAVRARVCVAPCLLLVISSPHVAVPPRRLVHILWLTN